MRKTGHSLPEIKKITSRSAGSIWKYVQGVSIPNEYQKILREKQGGSRIRSEKKWIEAKEKAITILNRYSRRDSLIFLSGLYCGEGSKRELSLINGDPYLIRSFLDGLYSFGVRKNEIRLSIRIYSDMDEKVIIDYWTKFLRIDKKQVGSSEVVKGNGSNRLIHGMCRVRVVKSGIYFKLIMSMIDYIKFTTKLS